MTNKFFVKSAIAASWFAILNDVKPAIKTKFHCCSQCDDGVKQHGFLVVTGFSRKQLKDMNVLVSSARNTIVNM
jgi:hypothetical protein